MRSEAWAATPARSSSVSMVAASGASAPRRSANAAIHSVPVVVMASNLPWRHGRRSEAPAGVEQLRDPPRGAHLAVQPLGWARRPTRQHVGHPCRGAVRHQGVGCARASSARATPRPAGAGCAGGRVGPALTAPQPRARPRPAGGSVGRCVARLRAAASHPTHPGQRAAPPGGKAPTGRPQGWPAATRPGSLRLPGTARNVGGDSRALREYVGGLVGRHGRWE